MILKKSHAHPLCCEWVVRPQATSIFTGSGNEDTEVDGEFAPLLLEAEHMELGLPPAEESDESTHSEAAIREVSI